MKKKSWFKPKAFTHITKRLTFTDKQWIDNYLSNPDNISSHKFFPLIHKTIAVKRYKKSVDKLGNEVKRHYTFNREGKKTSNVKYREIYFPNHLDTHIYAYYSKEILEPLYASLLEREEKLDKAVLAYRRIPIEDKSRCKSNIDFAKEVFDEIKSQQDEIAVLAIDISKFFDSIDHKILKQTWASLLDRKDLTADHYAIYKSITNFSYVELDRLLKEFGYKHPNQLIQKNTSYFVKNGHEFRERIKSKGYIKKNPFRRIETDGSKTLVGIPQGTPISPLLANLYLLNFDRNIISILEKYSGIYKRYSDDILIICPKASHTEIESKVYELIKESKLSIQPIKTQRSFFNNGRLEKGQKPVTYLGFQFDGHGMLVKSASIAKFYRKMKSNVKYRAFRSSLSKNKILHRKKLYTGFSFLGSVNRKLKKRNFISYTNQSSKTMSTPEIKNQLSKAWSILHEVIKKQEASYNLPPLKRSIPYCP